MKVRVGALALAMLVGCGDCQETVDTTPRPSDMPVSEMTVDMAKDAGVVGASCVTNAACSSGVCVSGTCRADAAGATDCSGFYCSGDESCGGSACEAPPACAPDQMCMGQCCGDNEVCADSGCLTLCDTGVPPCTGSLGEMCCEASQACLFETCVDVGPECDEQTPCPLRQYCEPTVGKCIDVDADPNACIYIPPIEDFSPVEAFNWTTSMNSPEYDQVMMMPVVGNLTDDNNDEAIDLGDVPDIVFVTFTGNGYNRPGVLRVISGDDGREHWASSTLAVPFFVRGGTTPTLADIDGDGQLEMVVTRPDEEGSGLMMVEHDGVIAWTNDTLAGVGHGGVSVVNLDGQGPPEIIGNGQVISATGELICQLSTAAILPTTADLDLDGTQEILMGGAAFRLTDVTRIDGTGCEEVHAGPGGFPAVANLDDDPNPEVVVVRPNNAIEVYEHDGTLKWSKEAPLDPQRLAAEHNIDPCVIGNHGAACTSNDDCTGSRGVCRPNNNRCQTTSLCFTGGGPPTIADFDGDGQPEIGVAARWYYLVYKRDGTILWAHRTKDFSSAVTGSSVFDFEGDGKAEVVYNDEAFLRVYRGAGSGVDADGDGYPDPVILLEEPNTSGTLYEYPLIVDVDNDGNAEIVVSANDYAFTGTKGIRVFRDARNNWVQTRRIWNQHAYHVTNIEEDGSIPANATPNWQVPYLNNFRQNVQGGGLFNAPDLVPENLELDAAECLAPGIKVDFDVRNQGSVGLRAGVVDATIYAGLAEPLDAYATITNATDLPPGGQASYSYVLRSPEAWAGKNVLVRVVIDDDGQGGARHNECNEDNNAFEGAVTCMLPQ